MPSRLRRTGDGAAHPSAVRRAGTDARLHHLAAAVGGGHASAAADRHGAGLQAGPADRGRGHDGLRRHHPGADPRADQDVAGRDRHAGAVRHPRHGRGGRDRRPGDCHVPWRDRRDRTARGDRRAAPASLREEAHLRPAGHRPGPPPGQPGGLERRGAKPGAPGRLGAGDPPDDRGQGGPPHPAVRRAELGA